MVEDVSFGRTAWKNLSHPTSILAHALNQRRGALASSPPMASVRQQDDIWLDYRKSGHQYPSSQSIDSGHFSQPGVLVVRSGSGSPESEELPISSTSAMWGEGFPRDT